MADSASDTSSLGTAAIWVEVLTRPKSRLDNLNWLSEDRRHRVDFRYPPALLPADRRDLPAVIGRDGVVVRSLQSDYSVLINWLKIGIQKAVDRDNVLQVIVAGQRPLDIDVPWKTWDEAPPETRGRFNVIACTETLSTLLKSASAKRTVSEDRRAKEEEDRRLFEETQSRRQLQQDALTLPRSVHPDVSARVALPTAWLSIESSRGSVVVAKSRLELSELDGLLDDAVGQFETDIRSVFFAGASDPDRQGYAVGFQFFDDDHVTLTAIIDEKVFAATVVPPQDRKDFLKANNAYNNQRSRGQWFDRQPGKRPTCNSTYGEMRDFDIWLIDRKELPTFGTADKRARSDLPPGALARRLWCVHCTLPLLK